MLYGKNGRKDDLVVRGARVLDPVEGVDAVLDVRVDKGTIAALGEGLDANGHRVVDGAGLVLAPAFVDPHVHLRVPGGEDEETIAQMYADRFKQSGFEVEIAHEGSEAVSKMAAVRPDVVLMDILMPGLSGTEAVEQAKADPATRNIPIIMLTNYPQSDDLKHALSLGAAGYIVKAESTPEQIVEKVQKLLTPKPGSG